MREQHTSAGNVRTALDLCSVGDGGSDMEQTPLVNLIISSHPCHETRISFRFEDALVLLFTNLTSSMIIVLKSKSEREDAR